MPLQCVVCSPGNAGTPSPEALIEYHYYDGMSRTIFVHGGANPVKIFFQRASTKDDPLR